MTMSMSHEPMSGGVCDVDHLMMVMVSQRSDQRTEGAHDGMRCESPAAVPGRCSASYSSTQALDFGWFESSCESILFASLCF